MVKVVTPDWILDSIDAGQKQDEALYHPTCLKLKGSHHHAQATSLSSPTPQRCNGDTTTAAATGEGERDREGEKNETQAAHVTSGDCARCFKTRLSFPLRLCREREEGERERWRRREGERGRGMEGEREVGEGGYRQNS